VGSAYCLAAGSLFVVGVLIYVGGACLCSCGSDDGVIVPRHGVPAS
jgi:hypothetical protein